MSWYHRAYRLIVVMLTALMLSGVLAIHAQSNSLTEIVQSADGSFSIRLPQSWVTQNTTFPGLPTVLVIGDSSTSLQSELDHMGSGQPNLSSGMSGFIARLDLSGFPGSSLDDIETLVLQSIGKLITDQGAQILNEQTVTTSGGYPADVTIVQDGTGGLRGYYGILQANDMLIQFQLTGRPVGTFTANEQWLGNIINSIRAPAEPVSNLQPTAVIATPIPVNPNPQPPVGGGGVVASDTGIFSIRLPQGWTHAPTTVDNFSEALVFGDSDASQQAVVDLAVNGIDAQYHVTGVGGFVGALALNGQAPDQFVSPLMQQILGSLTTDVTVTQPSQAHTFGGQYPGELALLNRGMIGVLRSQDQLLLVILISDDIATNQAAMTNLLESIRMPAEANQPAPLPTQATVPTAQPPQPQPTQSSGDTAQTYRSSDNQVSLVLPGPGTVLDHMADQNILAYGENDAAAQSRLYSVNPDLAPQTPISGTGGVIILYPMSRFQIDPQNPDPRAADGARARRADRLHGRTDGAAARGRRTLRRDRVRHRARLSGADPVRRSDRLRDRDDHAGSLWQ